MESIEINEKIISWSFKAVIITLVFGILFSTIVSNTYQNNFLMALGGILLVFCGLALLVLQYSIQQYKHYYFFQSEIERIGVEIIEHFNNDETLYDENYYDEQIKYLNSIATDSFQYDEIRKLQNAINLHKKLLNKK